MADNLEIQLDSLPSMSKDALSKLWQQMFPSHRIPHVRRHLIIRILAYRIQEQAFGGLTASARQRLRQIARAVEKDPAAEITAAPAFKPGTRLVRQWQNQTHVVTVKDKDYEYQGCHYRSLSEIARLITGTRWSGPLFFGTKANPAKSHPSRRSK